MGRKSRGKKRGPKSARPRRGDESPEARAFREHVRLEDQLEDAIGQAIDDLRRSGISIEVLDLGELAKLARPIAVVEKNGERLPVVEPRDPGRWTSARAFDMAMFAAGLRRFIRAPLPGDVIPEGAAPVVLVG
jgi:hypothetical protein